MKLCKKCATKKPLTEFYRHVGCVTDGHEGTCKACKKASVSLWNESNRGKRRAHSKKWNRANPVVVAAASKKWKGKNVARVRAYKRAHPDKNAVARAAAWNKAHPHVQRAAGARRRATQIHATPAWANLAEIKKLYEIAARRTRLTGMEWHVDHAVPLKSPLVCGLHVENNMQVMPARWNVAKGNRWWPDMPGATP